MKIRLLKSLHLCQDEKGFTLIETLVAILVGAMVMVMSLSILVVTNSFSLRVMAKSEAQQNTRNSIAKLFDTLAQADSLETCRATNDKVKQKALSDAANLAARPGVTASQCTERSSTGYVLALAMPNKLCYYDLQNTNFDEAALVRCFTRGGDGGSKSYANPAGPVSVSAVYNNDLTLGINLNDCASINVGSDPRNIYYYTCNPGVGDAVNWPTKYSRDTDSIRLIADLGTDVTDDPVGDLFEYRLDDNVGSASSAVGFPDLINVIAIDVRMDIKYDNKRLGTGKDTYKFKETIVLRGSKKATQESYNGE